MARTVAALPAGTRVTDYVSLGVLVKMVPRSRIDAVLAATGRASRRQRELPAHVVVYYVIALALYMQSSYREVLRCVFEGLEWIWGPAAVRITGKSGISQARTRLGWVPLKRLYDELVQPIAVPQTKGAWYRGWRVMSLDGSHLDVADTAGNVAAFGRPRASRGTSAYPQIHLVSLVENGTHVLVGAEIGPYDQAETDLAIGVLGHLTAGMLCLADRLFFGYPLWKHAHATGADLVWRIKAGRRLRCHQVLPDGSYLSAVYPSDSDRLHERHGIPVRVIDCRIEGVVNADPLYRVVTTILDPERAPAAELAALYPERWEIETAFDELKTHLRGARVVLRSKTPDLVRQECYGLLLAHYAIRGLMHEAALSVEVDPDKLSFPHAVRVVRRKLPQLAVSPPQRRGRRFMTRCSPN
jgi:hypothetical protein